jgi:hypothetical protein
MPERTALFTAFLTPLPVLRGALRTLETAEPTVLFARRFALLIMSEYRDMVTPVEIPQDRLTFDPHKTAGLAGIEKRGRQQFSCLRMPSSICVTTPIPHPREPCWLSTTGIVKLS